MDVEISLKFGRKRFDNASSGMWAFANELERAWDQQPGIVREELKAYLQGVAQELRKRHSGAWPGGTTDNTLSRRSGLMMRSLVRSVNVSGTAWDSLQGTIGGKANLLIHETGGTIRAKGGKLLSIPLPAALDARGVPLKKSAREWKNTFVAQTRRGNLVIFQRRGKSIIPLYTLKQTVVIPPRLGLRRELDRQLPHFVDRLMDRVADDVHRRIVT